MPSGVKSANAIWLKFSKCHQAETHAANAKLRKCYRVENQQMPSG
jgi:hypothetical protein